MKTCLLSSNLNVTNSKGLSITYLIAHSMHGNSNDFLMCEPPKQIKYFFMFIVLSYLTNSVI